jgi:hypothetical protein
VEAVCGKTKESPKVGMSWRQAYLIAKTLRSDDCDFVTYSLVGLEVEGEFGIVTFDDDFGRLLDGLDIVLAHAQDLIFCS